MYDEENQDTNIQSVYYDEQIDKINYELNDELSDEDDDNSSDNIYINNEEDEYNIIDDEVNLSGIKLTKDTLITESKKSNNKKKKLYFIHKKTNKSYEGIVIGQDINNNDKFVFEVYNPDTKSNIYKIIKYSDLKKILYK
jgi:hypothetical protein